MDTLDPRKGIEAMRVLRSGKVTYALGIRYNDGTFSEIKTASDPKNIKEGVFQSADNFRLPVLTNESDWTAWQQADTKLAASRQKTEVFAGQLGHDVKSK